MNKFTYLLCGNVFIYTFVKKLMKWPILLNLTS
jgi:hypothetical protein